ncbi:N-acetylglucosamine-6-phosphate deacetylase [Rubrobacter indicoceani]|uniref:N-acetylglucosamine-6-phosphate deacetylase n=1 Tax=Rubrobacter indicoceani TaxID=2051957 RepID=UPI0013C4A7BB|nr:N-acetylglucosamine-6-phosphate deacetylase [Rubrobacter indicoceani]
MIALKGRVVTDYEVWDDGVVLVRDGTIYDVLPDRSSLPVDVQAHDYGEALILPGFVDLQVNGAFGTDVATDPDGLAKLSGKLLSTGVTSYLPTVITSPVSRYEEVLPVLAGAMEPRGNVGAEPLGLHLEGPFIDLRYRGAHPAASVLAPDPGLLEALLDLAPVRLVTLAPEKEGSEALMELARNRGVVVSAGHTDANFDAAYATLDRYAPSVTHLFNAMSPLHHRAPGLVGAAFAHPRVVCGLIPDGRHVHPEMVALAFRMLGPDRVYLVTDSISAAGMGTGEYALASRRVYVEDDGVPRLGSGVIAGSVLTMGEAFKNILAFTSCTLPEAARMVASTPARLVGEGRRRGRLMPGFAADITVLGPDLHVRSVWKAGRRVYETNSF